MTNPGPAKFPADFLWGASIAAHQVEGFNVNDWSEWENANATRLAAEAEEKFSHVVPDWESIKQQATSPSNYVSGRAADHYAQYKTDIRLAKEIGLKALRFSVEWSRVQPQEGKYDEAALAHYVDMVKELRAAGIEPVITLHHRTNPVWVKAQGDWQNKKTVSDYIKYVEKIVDLLKNDVRIWLPINEPIMSLAGGYLGGVYPPGKKNIFLALMVFKNYVRAQNKAYHLIHSKIAAAEVGLSHAAVAASPYKGKLRNRLVVKLLHYLANHLIIQRTSHDFVGVQYYSRAIVDLRLGKWFLPRVEQLALPGPHSDMGWGIDPAGLYDFVKDIEARYHEPVYVTENGITDMADDKREAYIREHLRWLRQAMDEGVTVKGYFYWSLLDNLEWDKGFWPRFGLIAVDYKTYERTIRASARAYGEMIRNSTA